MPKSNSNQESGTKVAIISRDIESSSRVEDIREDIPLDSNLFEQKLSETQLRWLSAWISSNFDNNKANEVCGINKWQMYGWRKTPEFKSLMESIKELQYSQLEDALHRRALDDDRRSDNLLMFALKSHNPAKYCEKSQVEHVSRKDVKVTIQAEIAPGMEVIVPKVIEAEYHRVSDPGDNSQGQDLSRCEGTPLPETDENDEK